MTDSAAQKPALEKPAPGELTKAVNSNDVKAVRELLGQSADPNEVVDGRPVLNLAALLGHVEIVRLLLDHDAEVDKKTAIGITPLMTAASAGRMEIVRMLLDENAAIEATSKAGWTALMYSVVGKDIEVMRFLIDKGANVSIRGKKGETAESIAKSRNRADMAQLLGESYARQSYAIAARNQNILKNRAPTAAIRRRFEP